MNLVILALLTFTVNAQEPIKSSYFNEFKSDKAIEAQSLNTIKTQNKELLTNEITRSNSKTTHTQSQTISYSNNAWFNMNNLNNLGTGPFFCETVFNSNNGNTVGGKMTYLLVRNGDYNENPVVKSSNISFTAKKTNITNVSFQIQSRTGHRTPNIQFRITGDTSSATFNTKCSPILENI